MSIASPMFLGIATALMIGAVAVAWLRRVRMPRSAALCILVGMGLLALAAGGLSMRWPDPRNAVVMVDLSPSTRTAAYRDQATRDDRIRQLLGDVRYTVQTFAEGELVERTIFSPPPADAIVLLSDGQFDLPATAPPTYIVADPNLDRPADASIERLEARGEDLVATVHNAGQPRQLQFTGAQGPTTVPSGDPVVTAAIDPLATMIEARINSGDAWPENDALSIRPEQRTRSDTWWVDVTSWPANYRPFKPAELPTDAAAYLQPGVIVLNNIPASALSPVQQQRLMQYVRDLGGGLLILGGEQAFAAGGYLGTTLETLSPLASAPAGPQRYWIVLADSSGSMAGPVDGQTRWQRASAAVTQVLGALPPNDPVSVGSFARDLRWWSQGSRAGDAAKLPIPQDIAPSGPTNIQGVLALLGSQLRNDIATEIILISDADAAIDAPAALANSLRSARASVNLLLTGQNSGAPLIQVVAATSGNMIPQSDPSLWAQEAVKLAKSTMRDYVERRTTALRWTGPLEQLPARDVPLWNRTWIKTGATELASTRENNAQIALGANWRVGAGQVAAAAFEVNGIEAERLASLVEQPPRDPKFKVTHNAGADLFIRIDAVEGERYLNELDVSVSLLNEAESFRPPVTSKLAQTRPGRYELSLPAPRSPVLAVVRAGQQIIDRFAVAGRYAPEFDHIGNNREAMKELAARTGGAVIEPSQTAPIDFYWPARIVSLVSILSIAGAAFVILGLAFWTIR